MEKRRDIPDWEELYRTKDVEEMPWFHPTLDADLDSALSALKIRSGTALDLGTGPGTQAMALSELGFRVMATDVSATAVAKAAEKAERLGLEVRFTQDDILDTKLNIEFDFIFDRGCFHTLAPEKRGTYAETVHGLIKPGGHLFLKCFSHLETMEEGPYRFTPDDIRKVFSPRFEVVSIEDTVYQGTLDKFPKALFCVMKKGL